MKKTKILLLALLIFYYAGCVEISDHLGFSRPRVVSVYPSHLMNNVPEDTAVVVIFSSDMDREKTSDEFRLSSPSGPVEGCFNWVDGKTLHYTPRTPLIKYHMYTITVGSGSEDVRGNDLEKAYTSVFYTNDDQTPPHLVSHIPAADILGILPGQHIILTFSEPVDIDTIHDGITISPAVEGSFTWDPLYTTITFTPLYGLSYGTTYTVTVNTGITDVNGNNLEEAYSFNFTVGDDFTPPTIISVYQEPAGIPWDINLTTHGIEKNLPLVIVFSEPVHRNTLALLSLTPSAAFYLDSPALSDTVRLVFTAPLESETLYRLLLPSSITDAQGNRLTDDRRYFFYTDGALSVRPVVTAIYDPHLGRNWVPGAIETLTFPAPPSHDYPGVVIVFSRSMDPVTVTVDLSVAAGSPSLGPKVIEPRWNAAFTELTVSLCNSDSGCTYRFKIEGGAGGACDINGNYLKEDHLQYLRF